MQSVHNQSCQFIPFENKTFTITMVWHQLKMTLQCICQSFITGLNVCVSASVHSKNMALHHFGLNPKNSKLLNYSKSSFYFLFTFVKMVCCKICSAAFYAHTTNTHNVTYAQLVMLLRCWKKDIKKMRTSSQEGKDKVCLWLCVCPDINTHPRPPGICSLYEKVHPLWFCFLTWHV